MRLLPPRRAVTRLVGGVGAAAGALPGTALATAALVAGAVRRDKPLHPVGVVGAGRLVVTARGDTHGIPLLGTNGEHECTARWSRAMGREPGSDDIEGLAVRLDLATGPADLLFASTGVGTLDRHLLALRHDGEHGDLTTLLPVRTSCGMVTFRAAPLGWTGGHLPPERYEISVAGLGGQWQPVATLVVTWSADDAEIRFDPVLHPLPGTRQLPPVATLRAPAYWAARRGSPDEGRLQD
ncbi:phosphodiesterase [Actinomycetota bacterium]